MRLGSKADILRHETGMSAPPPKADVCGANRHVCFGPIADIGRDLICWLLDYLIGAREQRRRDCEAERFRRLEINYQIELGWQLNW